MTCFVCGKTITDDDERELFGMDGDFIHKKCAPNVNKAMEVINNMTDEEFERWLLGEVEQ